MTRSQDETGPQGEAIDAAARCVTAGGLIAFPTDTFYGLGADPFNEGALARLFAAKGRPEGRPVPLLLADAADIASVTRGEVPADAARLAEALWPGALTLVLPRATGLPDAVTAGGDTVGVRVPDHPVPRAIARAAGGPITGTSANRSGRPPIKTPGEVRAALGASVDLVVPGECGAHDAPSTVVDFTGGRSTLVREGAISLEAVRRICASAVVMAGERPRHCHRGTG